MKRQNKIVQQITQCVANVFSFYVIIAIEHSFSMLKHSPGSSEGENLGRRPRFSTPWDLARFSTPWDLANINARKTMLDPYIDAYAKFSLIPSIRSQDIERK